MKTRILRNELELKGFIEAAEKIHKIEYPMDYLRRSRVVGLFDEQQNLRGGFLLALRGPFRTLESLPEGVETRHIPQNRAAEINALWVDANCSGKKSARLWLRIFFEMVRSRKSHFLYTYSLKAASLGAIYAVVRPTVLYRGLTKTLPGMREPDEESVECFRMSNAFKALYRDPTFAFRKKRGYRYRHKIFTPVKDAL